MSETNQLCYKCKNNKPLNEFNKSSHHKTGYRNICRDCRNTHRAILRKHKKHYAVLLEMQNHCCLICGKSEKENGKRLSLDHNHSTHQVRGLLCSNCNTGLGGFKDNEELLSKAIAYLQKWNQDATA
jgi:hypothetical protein